VNDHPDLPPQRDGLFRLDGRVAVVTGTSSGLGERFARVLAAAGARVVLAARRAEPLRALAARLDDALPVPCDVTVERDRTRLVDAALDAHGRIDLLVNNAGTAWTGPAEEETEAHLARVLDTNLAAVLRLCQLTGRQMLAQGGGVVVNISSVCAVRSMDRYGLASYAASKAGVVALTRELAAQWGRSGVRENAIAPGWFPTPMNGYLRDPDQAGWIAGHTALGRSGRLDELDGALLFLAGDASSYVTGQTLHLDGGWTVY
jgi:hypothetical protein